ncbi:MAG: hypothetical protein ACQEQL_08910 [Pseudomonadota bacterium]
MLDTGFVIVAMLVLAAVMVWAFFTFSPEYHDKKALKVFNWSILGVIGMICLAFSLKSYALLSGSSREEFLPILLFLLNMMIIAVGLMIGFLLRNFFIFR